jgi:DNA-binding IclR family transcriptional regulator
LSSAAADDVVRQEMQKLADRFHVAVGLADRDRFSMIYVLRGRSRPYLAVTDMRVGSRVTIYKSATGWAYIVGMDQPARNSLLRQLKAHLGPEWPQTERHIQSAMQQHSTHGFVINCGVLAPGLNSIATPVRLPGGARLSMTCTGPESLLSIAKMNREIGPELLRVAKKLETMLPSHA